MSLLNISVAVSRFWTKVLRDGPHLAFNGPSWLRRGLSCHVCLLVAAASVVGFASVVSLWANSKRSLPNPQPSGVVAQPLTPNVRLNQRGASPAPSSISVETVTLTPRGFEPAEVTPATDKFVLGVDNRILQEELSLELVRENRHKIRQLKIAKGQIRLRKLLNLPAGRYTLQVMDHPEWRCSIVVP